MAETTPGRTIPLPTAPAGWSPPPPTTGVPAASPVAEAPRALDLRRDLGALVAGRQERGVELELAEELRAPAAVGDVEQQRARGVADLGRVGPGQAVADVVLGQEDLADPLPGPRLVLAEPEQLRRGEAGQCGVGDHPDQGLAAPGPLLDLGALGRGPLVVPEQGGADHPALAVEEDRAVHLPAQADPGDVRRPPARPGQDLADRRSPSRPTRARGPAPTSRVEDGCTDTRPTPRRGSRPARRSPASWSPTSRCRSPA